MHLFDRLKRWAETSDEDKVSLDRRLFLKRLAVTSAGILVPGAAVFDLGRAPRILRPGVLTDEQKRQIIREHLATPARLEKLARSLTQPLLKRVDYAAVGRDIFTVERLPDLIADGLPDPRTQVILPGGLRLAASSTVG